MKKKRKATHQKTPDQIEATRRGLIAIRDWCREGWATEPLQQMDRLQIWRIMDNLIEGYDPRTELGIPVKLGAPKQINGGFHKWMVGHYWHLRESEKDVVAMAIVVSAWGVSISQIKKVAAAHKDEWRDLLKTDQFRTDNFERMAEIYRNQLHK